MYRRISRLGDTLKGSEQEKKEDRAGDETESKQLLLDLMNPPYVCAL